MTKPTTRRTARRGRGRLALIGALLLTTAACDGLLDVEIPGSVEESDLNNPALAPTLFNSALGLFECAFVNYVATVGVLTEEYVVSSGWLNDNIWGWRGIELNSAAGGCSNNRDASGFGAYTPLQAARYFLEDAISRIESFDAAEVPNQGAMVAELTAHAGYAYTLLGEGFCSMAIDQGPELQPGQVLQEAEAYFTAAINNPASSENVRRIALLGRARVRLDRGNATGAASDAVQIPQGWVHRIQYATVQGSRENRVYNVTNRNLFLSVAPEYRDLEVGGTPDPRVPVADSGINGHDGVTRHFYQRKYTSAASPITLASWAEAKLILAEAAGGAGAVQHINELRAAQGIAPLQNPDVSNMLPVVLEERRRQLFTEGHRLNDMLRHGIPFPQGTNHKGQTYGPATCLPLPDQERDSNPNL